jgi:alpha-beta hydrolase superfamily lysophospholipase
MDRAPSLRVREPRTSPRSVVLVLHGGQARSTRPTRASNAASLRMIPFARALQRAADDTGLVVARLRYLIRGWNGSMQSPVPDARWALAQLGERYPDLPIALVGHSMGGRVALAVADTRGVRAVVALAPWVEPGDAVGPLNGLHLLVAHGTRDRVTDPHASAAFAEQAREAGARVSYLGVRGEGHAMLRRAGVWHALAAQFVRGALTDPALSGLGDGSVTNLVRRALAGEYSLVV